VVPVGEEVQIRMSGERLLGEVFSANDRVARPVQGAAGMIGFSSIALKGQSPGINPLVLTDDKGKSQLFLVVVPKPRR
jgi:hypothetical protein